MDLVRARRAEPDRYLAALLAPAGVQTPLLALTAFVADVATIPERVSQPLLGEMRLQWWRDCLAGLPQGSAAGHPVAEELARHVAAGTISVKDLLRIVDARSHDLTGEFHPDADALARHLGASEGLPFALAARLAGDEPWPDALIEAAGLAYGLARGFLRLGRLLWTGGAPITASALQAAGLDSAHLRQQPAPEHVAASVEAMAQEARAVALRALASARAGLRERGRAARTGALPLVLVEPYFAAQQRLGPNRLSAETDLLPLARAWRLAWAALSGRI
jgi:phytoene synthase